METKIIRMDEEHIDEQAIEEAGSIIRRGGLVAFPTETVYGLGGDALNGASSARIYSAKGRPSDNPLIVHIADMEALTPIVEQVPEAAYKLADRFWPGPLTMIFRKAQCVPRETTGGLDTVAVRMPSNKIARALIRAAGGYIAAPSANLSGRPSPTFAKYVIEDMTGRIDMILDGGGSDIGLESTILDLTGEAPTILRPGYITEELLREVIGGVELDAGSIDETSGQAPKAPGMKYRHYAPKGVLTIVEGDTDRVTEYISGQLAKCRREGKKTGVLAQVETAEGYPADSVKVLENEKAAAKGLFAALREFDEENVQVIYAEAFRETGVGRAVMNRLLKAAGHQIVHV